MAIFSKIQQIREMIGDISYCIPYWCMAHSNRSITAALLLHYLQGCAVRHTYMPYNHTYGRLDLTKRKKVSLIWNSEIHKHTAWTCEHLLANIVLKIWRSYDVFEHIVRYCARLKLEHRHCNEHHFNVTIVLISYGDALAPRLDVSVWHILDRQRRPLWSRSFIARLLELEALQFEREMLLDDESSLTDISKKESMTFHP